MNQEQLRAHLEQLITSMEGEDRSLLQARLQGLVSVFPFNEYEFIITFLVDRGVLSFSEYEALRANYVSANRYLDLFELSPRSFGQTWGERHLMDLDPAFQKPNRTLDPSYDGEYDLWIEGIRVEVKSSRAYDASMTGSLVSRALIYGSDSPFWMNYQQLKLDICDVFIFIGVWVDRIVYWVMSNGEVKSNSYLSSQHRGGIEYQIGMRQNNIREFDVYRVEAQDITNMVKMKSNQ